MALMVGSMGAYDLIKRSGMLGSDKILYHITSTLSHKNLLSSSLYLTLPFCTIVLIYAGKIWKLFAGTAIMLTWCIIIILQTRSVWLALLFSGVVAVICILSIFGRDLYANRRKAVLVTLLSFAIAVGSFFILQQYLSPILGKQLQLSERTISMLEFDSKKNEHTETIRERLRLWDSTIEIIKDHPLSGIGLGNWKIHFPSKGMFELRSDQGVINFQRPHNDFLWVWSEMGILGLIAYLLFFLFTVLYSSRIVENSTTPSKEKLIVVLCYCGIIGYCIIAFFDFPKERVLHLTLLAILTAIPLSIYLRSQKQPINKSASHSLVFVLLSCCIIGLVICGYRLNGEIHLKKAFKSNDLASKKRHLEQANSPFFRMDLTSMPISWYEGELYFIEGKPEIALNKFEEAKKQNPFQIHILNNLGTSYFLQGDNEVALKYYKMALNISPKFYDANLNLSVFHLQENNIDLALLYLLNCPPNNNHKRYIQVQKEVMGRYIDHLIREIEEQELRVILQSIKNDTTGWLTKIHHDAVKYNNPFQKRLLEDAIYTADIIEKSIPPDRAKYLRNKYLNKSILN